MDIQKNTRIESTFIPARFEQVEVPTGTYTITIGEPEYRRIGRIVLAYLNGVQAHVGPNTREAAQQFVDGLGYDAENTAVR